MTDEELDTGIEEAVGPVEAAVDAIVDNVPDGRVGAVLAQSMRQRLIVHVSGGLPEELAAVVADDPESGSLPSIPQSVTDDPDPARALVEWVQNEAGQLAGPLGLAFSRLVTGFVVANRADIIQAMKDAGNGPAEDRQDGIVTASALINTATSMIEEIPGIDSLDQATERMEAARDKLEEARVLLVGIQMDDAIMYGASAETETGLPAGVPELASGGRRIDVANLLFDSWYREVDAHLMLAAKVGDPIDGTRVVDDGQRDYILDALVAVQEAFSVRPDAPVLLRFGQLRLAKGDVGEARMAAEKVLELVPDESDPTHMAAVDLMENVARESPLTRKDKRCFIATAAMDDVDAPEVEALRAFRDRVLFASTAGRVFVRIYYRCSPPLASYISRHRAVRLAVRRYLVLPLAAMAGLSGDRRRSRR